MRRRSPGASATTGSCSAPAAASAAGVPRRPTSSSPCPPPCEGPGMSWPTGTFWGITAGLTACYLLLFLLARRPVSLRPGRLAVLAGLAVGLRLVLLACGEALESPLDRALSGLALAAAVGLVLLRRAWLVRSSAAALREELGLACRGLFLDMQEPREGRIRLVGRGEHELRMIEVGKRLQVLVLGPVPGPGKVALLLNWLAKQYPGPVPRVRIVLEGGGA